MSTRLAAKVMAGEKTVTRRLVSENPRSPWYTGGCKLKVGRNYAVCPGRGKPGVGFIEIVSVQREPEFRPAAIGDAEAAREGFRDALHFMDTWWQLHDHRDPSHDVWRIAFVVAKRSALI